MDDLDRVLLDELLEGPRSPSELVAKVVASGRMSGPTAYSRLAKLRPEHVLKAPIGKRRYLYQLREPYEGFAEELRKIKQDLSELHEDIVEGRDSEDVLRRLNEVYIAAWVGVVQRCVQGGMGLAGIVSVGREWVDYVRRTLTRHAREILEEIPEGRALLEKVTHEHQALARDRGLR